MAHSIENRTFQIVSDVLNIPREDVKMETSHDTVANWDSLNMINLLLALEAEFKVGLDIEDATDLVSVNDIVHLLRKRGAE